MTTTNTALTLESRTVIRVGMPDAPYIVGVVRGPKGLRSARIRGDVDNLPAPGSPLELVSEGPHYPTYQVITGDAR